MMLALYVDKQDLKKMHRDDIAMQEHFRPLNAEKTVPKLFRKVFDDLSEELHRYWNINEDLQSLVEEVENSMGWNNKTYPNSVIAAHVR